MADWDAIAIVISVIVGSGIFASPGIIMATVGSVGLGLLSWVIAGVLATASSLVYCELGAMLPSAPITLAVKAVTCCAVTRS